MFDETDPPPPGEDSCLLPPAGTTREEEKEGAAAVTTSGDRTAAVDNSLFFLAISCSAALLQDANEVVFLTLLQPAAWLAFAAAATTTATTTTTTTTRTVPLTLPRPRARSGNWYFAIGWMAIMMCRAVPAMDYFYYDTTRSGAYGTSLVTIFIVYSLVGMAVLVQISAWRRPRRQQQQQHDEEETSTAGVGGGIPTPGGSSSSSGGGGGGVVDDDLYSPFIFAILSTALFQLLLRFSPIGGVGSPAMGLARLAGLRQVASLVGEIGLVFLITWSGTLWAGSWHHVDMTTTTYRQHVTIWSIVVSGLLTYGCIRESFSAGWYLRDIDDWPLATAPRLQVSCITRPKKSSSHDDGRSFHMLAWTHERLAAGDDLILWSESAVPSPVAWNNLAWNVATNPASIVATTFFRPVSSSTTKSFNVVALYNATGLVSEYSKNRPVPVVEGHVTAGTIQPTAQTVTFAPAVVAEADGGVHDGGAHRTTVPPFQRKIATAICFDLDFDYLSRHAATADVMIGPSWYWASIGPALWYHNTFRAIENGFHLLKCSERGISGHIDPRGRAITALPTLNGQIYTWQVPLTPGLTTVYASIGYLFGWLCVSLAPFVLLRHALGGGRNHHNKRCCGR